MSNPRPNTEGLHRATEERSQAAYADVQRALRAMIRAGERITVQGVARRSGRSARYIRTHPTLGPEVRKHRYATADPRPLQVAPETTDSTIAALRHHMKVMEREHQQEARDLRQQLSQAHEQIERLTARLVAHPDGSGGPAPNEPASGKSEFNG